jgi:hypothetical protein
MAAKFLRGDFNLPRPGRIVLTGRGFQRQSSEQARTVFGQQICSAEFSAQATQQEWTMVVYPVAVGLRWSLRSQILTGE